LLLLLGGQEEGRANILTDRTAVNGMKNIHSLLGFASVVLPQ